MKQALMIILITFFVSCRSESESEYDQRLVEGACHCRGDARMDLEREFADSNAIYAMPKAIKDSLLDEEVPDLMILAECMKQHGFKEKDVDNFWESSNIMKTFHCDSVFDLYQRYVFHLKHDSY